MILDFGNNKAITGLDNYPTYTIEEVLDAVDQLPEQLNEDYDRVNIKILHKSVNFFYKIWSKRHKLDLKNINGM